MDDEVAAASHGLEMRARPTRGRRSLGGRGRPGPLAPSKVAVQGGRVVVWAGAYPLALVSSALVVGGRNGGRGAAGEHDGIDNCPLRQ